MKTFFAGNKIQDYGFLSCRNELLSLAIVLTYDSMENCGIWINNSCGENFHSALPRDFSLHSCY